MFSRQGSEYRQIFREVRLDWCKMMAGESKTQGLINAVVDSLKACCPKVFRKCPIVGKVNLLNMKTNKNFFNLAPKGTFRVVVKIHYSNKIAKASVFGSTLVTVT